jgi:uncharacterized protein with NAD-binding domain and iron-sulfur cluster
MKALVMGGGMSGLAAAINLLDLGVEVELIEADNMFGGRATSWLDEDGDMIDNALHVFFPYYVNLVNFFKKMGIYENIIWKDPEFYYMQEDGKEAVLRFPNLPAPLHAAAAYVSLIRAYTGLPKWKMIFTALGMGIGVSRYSKAQLDELDDITFGMWSMRMAPKGAFKPMEPGINGLTFTPSSMISAKVMINWFKKVSGSAETSRVGFANGGLGEIWVDNCLDFIKGKGGTCELDKAVTSINIEDGKVKSVTVNGSEERTADLYVSAISPYALRRVMPAESFKLDYFQDLWHFQYAPSLSLQTWFDRKLPTPTCRTCCLTSSRVGACSRWSSPPPTISRDCPTRSSSTPPSPRSRSSSPSRGRPRCASGRWYASGRASTGRSPACRSTARTSARHTRTSTSRATTRRRTCHPAAWRPRPGPRTTARNSSPRTSSEKRYRLTSTSTLTEV